MKQVAGFWARSADEGIATVLFRGGAPKPAMTVAAIFLRALPSLGR